MDNFSLIYKILAAIEASMDLRSCDSEMISAEHLGISQERWASYMEMLRDA